MNHHPKKITDEELLKRGYVRCYRPPVNPIHLADYILVPILDVYEYTKELYNWNKKQN